mgnify:CR=1 FL=1
MVKNDWTFAEGEAVTYKGQMARIEDRAVDAYGVENYLIQTVNHRYFVARVEDLERYVR